MAGPNDPDSYERAELEQRVGTGLSPEPPRPPPSRRRFGRLLDILDPHHGVIGQAVRVPCSWRHHDLGGLSCAKPTGCRCFSSSMSSGAP